MMTKQEAAAAVRAAKVRLELNWAQLAEAVGEPVAWTVSALPGQQPMTREQAGNAVAKLELGEDVRTALQLQPTQGALDAGDQGADPRGVRRRHHERHQLRVRRQARARPGRQVSAASLAYHVSR